MEDNTVMWVFTPSDSYQTVLNNNLLMPRPIKPWKIHTYAYIPLVRSWYKWRQGWLVIGTSEVPNEYKAKALLIS